MEFNPDGAIFIGENGCGKTNILESIHFMAMGRSQRSVSRRELVNFDSYETFIECVFSDIENNRKKTISIGFDKNKKLIMKQNKIQINTFSELFGSIGVVSFGSHDAMLIYGEPSFRRKYMDMVISQVDEKYLKNLIVYKHNLLQRNKILSLNILDDSISIYEEKMAECSSYIFIKRAKLFDTIGTMFSDVYKTICGNVEYAGLVYRTSLMQNCETREEWVSCFLKSLKDNRKKDQSLGYTTTGPHRDDFKCYLNDKLTKSFGSQGQCRSMALSLRLCSMHYLQKNSEKSVLLLLDDAFSELDMGRKQRFFSLIEDKGQVFLTSLSDNESFNKNFNNYIIKNNTVNLL